MQRVSRSTAVAQPPAPPANPGAPGYFTGGDPISGLPATVPGYEWFNAVQEELVAIVAAAGLTPDWSDNAQVITALRRIFGEGALGRLGIGMGLEDDGAGNARIKLADASLQLSAAGLQANPSQVLPPCGRLTLGTAPVSTSEYSGASTVNYLPYVGATIPIHNGQAWTPVPFSSLSLSLTAAAHPGGNIYDVFAALSNGVAVIGTGPAWSAATTRGTGAGSTQIQQVSGLWTNAAAITLTNGSTTYAVPAGRAAYLGSVLTTGAGQTAMQHKPAPVSGGSSPVLGVWNAYNRVGVNSLCQDNAASWTYNSTTWRRSDNSQFNRVRYIDGLGYSHVSAVFGCQGLSSTANFNPATGVAMDWTSGPPSGTIGYGPSTVSLTVNLVATNSWAPVMGMHEIAALECSTGNTVTYYGASVGVTGQSHGLRVTLEM